MILGERQKDKLIDVERERESERERKGERDTEHGFSSLSRYVS